MNRFKFTVFKRFWDISKLYWFGDEQKNALGLLFILVVLLFANTQVKVLLNTQQGEQQRLAFARILLRKPKYTILDEATSALDVHNEEHLYRLLLETGTTFISVGHRPNLKKYHEIIITLP